jgi:signal transduction histidine kinase
VHLGAFIRRNEKQIVEHWEAFAGTLMPAAEGMSPLGLRNHILEILAFIADDLESSQTDSEQVKKSEGEKPRNPGQSAAEIHASLRQAGGFNMEQMVSEFRALRASVIKLWQAHLKQATNSDLSDLTRFNESIDQALTEAISFYTRKLDHRRDLSLGVLSHDLRSPIGAMLMSAQLTLKIGPINEHQTMLVSQIIASAHRANEMLDYLLDLTRARLGSGLQVIRKHMDMGFVSRRLVDEMRATYPGRTFTIDIQGETDGNWDKPRIGQVFSNLLGNAVRYGFQDTPIGIKIKGDPEAVLVSVHNEGVPIPPEAMQRIFDPLNRGEHENSYDGPKSTHLGLGLYITKEIVTAHGGTLDVTSSEENGTTFNAWFPRSQ